MNVYYIYGLNGQRPTTARGRREQHPCLPASRHLLIRHLLIDERPGGGDCTSTTAGATDINRTQQTVRKQKPPRTPASLLCMVSTRSRFHIHQVKETSLLCA